MIYYHYSHLLIDFSDVRCTELQDELTRVILRLLITHKELCYYQGLHDITLTLLLVLGEDVTFAVMNILVQYHLR